MKSQLKIKIIKPVSGTFGLSANVGDEISIDGDQASEMVDKQFAVLVDAPTGKPKKENNKPK